MPLRYVDPNKTHGPVYRASVRFGRSRPGQFVGRRIQPRVDRVWSRLTRGRGMSFVRSAPLVTTGAKSGLRRRVQLAYFHDGRTAIVMASNYGGERQPQWYHNLKANPDCELAGEPFRATQVVDPDEYQRLFGRAVQVYAGWGDYRDRANRQFPIFRLEPR